MWFDSKDAPESLEAIISKQICESGPEFIYLLENPLPPEPEVEPEEEIDEIVIEDEATNIEVEEEEEEQEEVVEEEKIDEVI